MQVTTFAIFTAALAGNALAIGDCVPGRYYCGFTFLDSCMFSPSSPIALFFPPFFLGFNMIYDIP